MRDGKIRYAASSKSLEDKIKVKMEQGANTIYWHIKFNLPLDPSSVNEKTMYVTDLAGYILETYIEYDEEKHLIVITPLQSYEENYYYILNITTDVKSAKGQNLRRSVIILFKLLDDEIAEMTVLPTDTKAPAPEERPKEYNPYNVKSKVFSDGHIYENVATDKLKALPLDVNPFFAIGAVGVFAALMLVDWRLGLIGLAITTVFVGLLMQKVLSSSTRAVISYNAGVRHFNRGRYVKAKIKFNKAFILDSQNETIEYALSKVEYYI